MIAMDNSSMWDGTRRSIPGSEICVHSVGLTSGMWCSGCLSEAWQHEYAPGSNVMCTGLGCSGMGPCVVHRSDVVQNAATVMVEMGDR